MSISPAHRTLPPVQTGLQMAAVPHSFNMVWDRALLLSLLWKSTVTKRCPKRTRKDSVPSCLDPRGLEPSVTPLPTNQRGISPAAPTLPRPSLLRDVPLGFVPCPAAVICSGPGSGDKRGSEGLDRGGGGAAPIHFRTVRDHHCLPSHPVTYYYPNRCLTPCVFL